MDASGIPFKAAASVPEGVAQGLQNLGELYPYMQGWNTQGQPTGSGNSLGLHTPTGRSRFGKTIGAVAEAVRGNATPNPCQGVNPFKRNNMDGNTIQSMYPVHSLTVPSGPDESMGVPVAVPAFPSGPQAPLEPGGVYDPQGGTAAGGIAGQAVQRGTDALGISGLGTNMTIDPSWASPPWAGVSCQEAMRSSGGAVDESLQRAIDLGVAARLESIGMHPSTVRSQWSCDRDCQRLSATGSPAGLADPWLVQRTDRRHAL